MVRPLTRVLIALLLFAAMAISSAGASGIQATIIYSNDINGQIDPIG